MNTNINNKRRFLLALSFILLLCMGLAAISLSSTKKAEASTNLSAYCKTYGYTSMVETRLGLQNSYANYYGSPYDFDIFMCSSSTDGTKTISTNEVLNWDYVNISLESHSINRNLSFVMTRNGANFINYSYGNGGPGHFNLYNGHLQDGNYNFTYVGEDRSSNYNAETYTYTFSFIIDCTSPTYNLSAGGVNITFYSSYVKSAISYSASDMRFSQIFYKSPQSDTFLSTMSSTYIVQPTKANNGKWEFYAQDSAGNKSYISTINLDTVKPLGEITANGATVSNGGYTNKPFSFSATDLNGVISYEYKSPTDDTWQAYAEGTELSDTNGRYTFRCTDKAKNLSDEYTVCYDNVVPTQQLYAGNKAMPSGTKTNAAYVSYSALDLTSGISKAYVKLPSSNSYIEYTIGSQFTIEGVYSFYTVDKAGNRTEEQTIVLDKTDPCGTLYAEATRINNNAYTNAKSVKFISSDDLSGVANTFVLKPNTSFYIAYISGSELTAEGVYKFYATDLSGNTSIIYTVTLDKTAPIGQIFIDGVKVENGSYTNGGHIHFIASDLNFKNCFVKKPGDGNFAPYANGSMLFESGKYTFFGTDEAGNTTGNYSVVIDRTKKPLTVNNVSGGVTDGNVTLSWIDGNPDIFAPVISITVNGKTYENGQVIRTIDTGKYTVESIDAAGNVWSNEFKSTAVNVPTKTLQKEYFEAPSKGGNIYSFESYNNALAFALAREKTYVRAVEWNNKEWDTGIAMDEKDALNAANGVFYIYKKSDDSKTEVAYFTEARLSEVLAEYAKDGIKSYFYFQKTPAEIYTGNNLYAYLGAKIILASSVTFNAGVNYSVDGAMFSGLYYDTEGVHKLVVSDEYGNECEYLLTIIRKSPSIEYALGSGGKNTVTFEREYFLKNTVTLSITDPLDEMAMFYVFGDSGELIAMLNLNEVYTLNKSGKYIVQAVNHFGESREFILNLSLGAPKIEGNILEEEKRFCIEIIESEDTNSGLQTIQIYKSKDNGATWMPLNSDDYGAEISTQKLNYFFKTSGEYKVVITDEFRTGIDAVTEVFTYAQSAPSGTLDGALSGGYTNTNVTFTWTDEAIVGLKKDGTYIAYTSGEILTASGAYELTFENCDGYLEIITFFIDKNAPVIELNGATEGQKTSGDVTVELDEEGLIIKLYKNEELVGDYVSGTVLNKDGSYKITATDSAGNLSEVTFEIDKRVDFNADIYDNILTDQVTFTANEELEIVITKDGESIAYKFGEHLNLPGKYNAVLTDKLGNAVTIKFAITEKIMQSFFHNFDDVFGFTTIYVNGVETRLNYGDLEIKESGTYEIKTVVSGKEYTFTVSVDSTAPSATVTGVVSGGKTKDAVTITSIDETVTVKAYLNDVEFEYKLGDTLTGIGKYRIILTDAVGNASEYTFEILYVMNSGATVFIIIVILCFVGAAIAVVLLRKKGKFGKKKQPIDRAKTASK